MKIDILTLFPEMFAPLQESLIQQAQDNGIVEIEYHNFRRHAINKHGHVDDYPYGGGAGMLLRVEPIVNTLEEILGQSLEPGLNNLLSSDVPTPRIILVDPTGVPFHQGMAQSWSQEDQLIFICGHYEGYDERIRHYVTEEVSLGDYVLTGGELPAMVMIDATVRLIPEVVGNAASILEESHQNSLLEQPQYTRPREFRGQSVPDVLVSGDHQRIAQWTRQEAIRRTYLRRPDLLAGANLTPADQVFLQALEAEPE